MSAASAKLTPKKRAAFLDELAKTGNVTAAASAAGLDRQYTYKLRDKDKQFRADWDAALDVACDALEAEARRRAVDGVQEPVFYQGVECGAVRRYSDVLLIFLLKGNRPDKFKERAEVHSTGTGAAVQIYLPENGRTAKVGDDAE